MSLTSSDVVWSGIGAGATALGGFAFAWIVARALGPAGSGTVASFATWFLALTVVGKLGMDTGLVWSCARSSSGAEPAPVSQLRRWAIRPAMLVTGAVSVLLWVHADSIGPWALAAAPGTNLSALVMAGAVLLPVAVLTLLLLSMLRGVGHPKPLLVIDQVVKPLFRLASAALAFALLNPVTAQSMVGAWLSAIPLCLLLTVTVAYRIFGHPLRRLQRGVQDRQEARESRRRLYRFAGPRSLAQIIDTVSASVGTLLLAVLGTATDTGLFATALRIALAGQLALTAMRLLVAPIFAFDLSRGSISDAQRTYTSATVLIVVASWPLYLAMLGAPQLLLGAFGTQFGDAAMILMILAVGALLQSALGNLQAAVLMSGGSGRALAATIGATAVNILVVVTLFGSLGGTAAALGWTASVWTESAVLCVAVKRLGLHPGPAAVRRAAMLAICVLGPTWVAVGRLWDWSPLASVALSAIGLVAYILVIGGIARRAWRDLTSGRKRV